MHARHAAFLLAFLTAATSFAQENLFIHVPDPRSDTRVEVTALFSRASPDGYLPLRVTVVNKGTRDLNLNFACRSADSGWGNSGSEMSSSFSLAAAAEKTTEFDRLVPLNSILGNHWGGGASVTVRMSGALGDASGSLSLNHADNQPAVLLSEPLYTPNASALDAAAGGRFSGRYGSASFAGKFDPRRLPEDWRAYSGYDALAMTDADWGLVSPGARNAILQWNRLGGRVVIYSLNPGCDLNSLGVVPGATGIRDARRSSGEIRILPLAAGSTLPPAETIDLFTGKAPLPTLNSSLREDFSTRGWPLQAHFGEVSFNYALFIFVLVAFGILVGPVNLFVFAKSGRRHRLFVTTPLIALGASALLILLIILQDGFGGRGMRVVLMEVRPDDGENAAYITQEQISRTGVLLGGRFEVNEAMAIHPLPLNASRWTRLTHSNYGGGMVYETNLADGRTKFAGDWFQSRSEQGQLVRAVIPTRGRIEARNEAGAPSFLSTFEFPIESFFYTDASGGVWVAGDIQPGKVFTCRQADPTEPSAFVTESRNRLSERTRRCFDQLAGRREHYVARTSAAPGVATFGAIDWKNTTTLLTGPVARP